MKLGFLVFLLTASLSLFLSFPQAQASNDYQSYDYAPLPVDGSYNRTNPSPSDKMKDRRKQLEKKNEMLIRQKIETLRLQREMQLEEKIQNMFEQKISSLNTISKN